LAHLTGAGSLELPPGEQCVTALLNNPMAT